MAKDTHFSVPSFYLLKEQIWDGEIENLYVTKKKMHETKRKIFCRIQVCSEKNWGITGRSP